VGSDAIALDQTWRQALQKNGNNAQAAMAEIQPVYNQVRARWAGSAMPCRRSSTRSPTSPASAWRRKTSST
jgi:hypothetical protein